MSVVRALLFLALSAVLSWQFLLRQPDAAPLLPQPVARTELAVAPAVVPAQPSVPKADATAPSGAVPETSKSEPRPEERMEPQPEPTPPPKERGDPDGDESEERDDPVPEKKPAESREQKIRREHDDIRQSSEQIEEATSEVTGETRRGFRTVLYSAAEDQLAIARYFGEQLVVVPRKGLDPRRPHYFLVDAGAAGTVNRVNEKAPLHRFRQYRDFFAFEYSDLPGVVRALRRKVPVRSEIFLFAALIPPSEWAVVMARRVAALDTCQREQTGQARTIEDLRRVEMRYVALPGGGFDIEVKQLVFADGKRWTQQP